ncbi:hypothetical protein L596_007401 [Steinernema carpocapsae]|uniref:Endoplasmic reticulum lectin 1 n=1 Tax=Steinernema carpocapsae TaxID=34508 RepID=A0A4U5P963_STECR|nr:hypothetical protein L596_007401 [Steinernema carpocapsae]
MNTLRFLAVFLGICRFCWSKDILPHLRDIDDSIGYRIKFLTHTAVPEVLLSAPEDQILSLVSADNEKYLCQIPNVEPANKKTKLSSYSGPSPADLVAALHTEQCSLRTEGFWSYEICHGRYISQFHEEKGGGKSLEFFLGNFRSEEVAKEAATFDDLNPPTRRIEGVDLAYYPVVYRQGSVCDITGSPRVATVNYVCWPKTDDYIQSVAETSSCVYEIFVYTKHLCSHPSFQPPVAKEHDINCYAQHDGEETGNDVRPKGVLKMEEDLRKSFHDDYKIGSAVKEDVDDDETTLFKINLLEGGEINDADYKEILKMLQSVPGINDKIRSEIAAAADSLNDRLNKKQKPASQGSQEGNDVNLADIFSSKCIVGGSGWWKYEICYGEKVVQFHEDQEGRQEIVLGYFDKKLHKVFIDQNPKKRPVVKNDKIMEVTHLYSSGDLCDAINAHRSVEVKLSCRVSESPDLQMFLLEPGTCQYLLNIQSSLFCNELQTADAYGMLSMDQKIAERRAAKEEQVIISATPAEVTPGTSDPKKTKFHKEVLKTIPGPAAAKQEKQEEEEERLKTEL